MCGVCHISLIYLERSDLEKHSAAMQVPFPELTYLWLWLWASDETVSALPESFLGGSAPRLEQLWLHRVASLDARRDLLCGTLMTQTVRRRY
jgi:hypothetical protein